MFLELLNDSDHLHGIPKQALQGAIFVGIHRFTVGKSIVVYICDNCQAKNKERDSARDGEVGFNFSIY